MTKTFCMSVAWGFWPRPDLHLVFNAFAGTSAVVCCPHRWQAIILSCWVPAVHKNTHLWNIYIQNCGLHVRPCITKQWQPPTIYDDPLVDKVNVTLRVLSWSDGFKKRKRNQKTVSALLVDSVYHNHYNQERALCWIRPDQCAKIHCNLLYVCNVSRTGMINHTHKHACWLLPSEKWWKLI